MDEQAKYIISQLNIIPQKIYLGFLTIFCIGTVALTVKYRKKAYWYIAWLLLMEYLFFAFGLTVFYRKSGLIRLYYPPFWSYLSIFRDRNMVILYETILNVILFIPIGFLWGIISSRWSKKRQWISLLILGLSLSAVIELLQLYFKKGCVEVDDVIHNILGCLIGFAFLRGVSKLFAGIKTRSA